MQKMSKTWLQNACRNKSKILIEDFFLNKTKELNIFNLILLQILFEIIQIPEFTKQNLLSTSISASKYS
jgi:hypothetical protein